MVTGLPGLNGANAPLLAVREPVGEHDLVRNLPLNTGEKTVLLVIIKSKSVSGKNVYPLIPFRSGLLG